MKLLLGLIVSGMMLFGDSIVQTTNIVATAGTGTGQVVCTFSNPNAPSVHVVCTANGVTYTTDGQPPIGVTNGLTASDSYGGNTINWQLQQLTAGTVTYQIAANSVNKSGTF